MQVCEFLPVPHVLSLWSCTFSGAPIKGFSFHDEERENEEEHFIFVLTTRQFINQKEYLPLVHWLFAQFDEHILFRPIAAFLLRCPS